MDGRCPYAQAAEMLPLLSLDTGTKSNNEKMRERREQKAGLKRNKEQNDSNDISKERRSHKPILRRGVRLDIKGPIPEGPKRDAYFSQIFDDLDSICESKIDEGYLEHYMLHGWASGLPIPMGYPGNPLLWVITDRHVAVKHTDEEDDQLIKETVFGFALATRRTYESQGDRSMFELNLICSQRGMGIVLFRHILRFAIDQQGNPDSLFANVFTLSPINQAVSKLYEDAANEVLGRPLLYMADGHLLVILNINERVRAIYNDLTISREEFYNKIG